MAKAFFFIASVILSDPLHTKMSMPNSQRYPLNLYLINIVEDFVVFLGLNEFTSDNLVFKTMNKNILFST